MNYTPLLLVIETQTGYVRRYVGRKRDETLWHAKPEELGSMRDNKSIERVRLFGKRSTPTQPGAA